MRLYSKETTYGNITGKKYGKILVAVVPGRGNYGWVSPFGLFSLDAFLFLLQLSPLACLANQKKKKRTAERPLTFDTSTLPLESREENDSLPLGEFKRTS